MSGEVVNNLHTGKGIFQRYQVENISRENIYVNSVERALILICERPHPESLGT